MIKLNVTPKLNAFKYCLKQWQHKKMPLLGKSTVIKTLVIPDKNDIFHNVIWNHHLIKLNNIPLFYKKWYDKGVKYLWQLFDFRIKTLFI